VSLKKLAKKSAIFPAAPSKLQVQKRIKSKARMIEKSYLPALK
jgi:hypothetical protein